ncbi:hypothetical protein [Nonomuraea sp. NPDC049625]|uniref:hypothetical protein n=1 Tax=Nonomuraea sp. NPDC049625 TaxID=3155775 RepID=UPI003414ADAD
MTHADPVGSVDGSSSTVGFGVLEREREDGAADSVTVTVGVGDADVIPDPGSPPARSAARATINPPMPARALTISQWMRSRQDFRPFRAGREGPFDPGAEEPIEVTSDLLLMKDPRREQEKQSQVADFSTPRLRPLPPTCRGSFAGDGGFQVFLNVLPDASASSGETWRSRHCSIRSIDPRLEPFTSGPWTGEIRTFAVQRPDPSRRPKGTYRHSVAHVAVGVRQGTTMVYLRRQGPVETDPAAALRTGQAAIMHTLDRLPVGG